MTPTPNHNPHESHHSSDPGARKGLLNEAMLCDLIEGHLAEDKAESARTILARDRVLNDTLAQIEHDRAVLQSLGDEMCPADMFSRLEPILEREILLEQEAHGNAAELRHSPSVVVRQQRTWRIPAMVFASAAALVVVTGIVLFAQQFMASLPGLAPGGSRVASNSQNDAVLDPAPIDDLVTQPDANTKIALADQTDIALPVATDVPPLIDQPVIAIRLAKAGKARFHLAGVSADQARVSLASLNTTDAPWHFEGLETAGPIFCMVDPVPSAWTSLTFALRESGMTISLEEFEPEPLKVAPEQILWWQHRATWAVPRARLPITFDE